MPDPPLDLSRPLEPPFPVPPRPHARHGRATPIPVCPPPRAPPPPPPTPPAGAGGPISAHVAPRSATAPRWVCPPASSAGHRRVPVPCRSDRLGPWPLPSAARFPARPAPPGSRAVAASAPRRRSFAEPLPCPYHRLPARTSRVH